MIKGVHHFALSTGNLKRLLQFYCDALGFELVVEMGWERGTELGAVCDGVVGLRDSTAKAAMVSKGGVIVEMFEFSAPDPKPIPTDWKVCDHGYTHLCIEVEDIDAEYERLKNSGMTFHAPPRKEPANGMRAVYGRDPDGRVIEILEIFPAS
jgi:glyoxylase I family protein